MAPNPTDGNNGRVTMAILGTKMDGLTKLLETHIEIDRQSQEKRDDRIRANEMGVVRLDQRMKLITGALVGLQMIGSTIAAFLGIR